VPSPATGTLFADFVEHCTACRIGQSRLRKPLVLAARSRGDAMPGPALATWMS
jgi:hypothetical protein